MHDHLAVDLRKTAKDNTYYRRVLFTSNDLQLVIMSIPAGTNTGFERHEATQHIRVEKGSVEVNFRDCTYVLKKGDTVTVPCCKSHCISNVSDKHAKISTIYGKPMHHAELLQKVENHCIVTVRQ